MDDRSVEEIAATLAAIEAKRAAMPPAERAALEVAELDVQRKSWVRAMAPCEHGDPDWENCLECRTHLKDQSHDQ